jgi:hypothetical protein
MSRAEVGQATHIPDSMQRAVQAVHESDPEDHERHMVDRLPERGTGVQAGDERGRGTRIFDNSLVHHYPSSRRKRVLYPWLTDAELARIDEVFPLGPPPRALPIL